MGKNNKAIGFFSYLLVLATLILYSYAFIKIAVIENSKVIKSLEKLKEIEYFKQYIELDNYLLISFNISFNNALDKFLNNFDNSQDCKTINKNNEKYFSFSCNFNKTIFLNFLKQEFEKYVKIYLDYGKNKFDLAYDLQSDYDEEITYKLKFYKNFDVDIMNLSLEKQKKFNKKIDLSILDKFDEIKEKINKKLKNNEEIKEEEFEIEKLEENNIIYIKIKTKRKFLVVEENIKFKQLELKLYYEK